MSIWPDLKRFLELYYAEPDFSGLFADDPVNLLSSLGFSLNRALLEDAIQDHHILNFCGKSDNPYIIEYRNRISAVRRIYAVRENPDNICNRRFQVWYRRQRNRLSFTCRSRRKRPDTSPVAFELSSGCSVQCPFCCFAPEKLGGVFEYNPGNKKLWRSMLIKIREIIGDLLKIGICYHATEPFDNPDYERFLSDYHQISGVWPQTTTALASRRVSRLRKLMQLIGSRALKEAALRVSITTLSQLHTITREFSPEEFQYVEMNLNNPESIFPYSAAGRAADLEKKSHAVKLDPNATSSCIAGFLINTVDKSIVLMSPEVPSAEFPLGLNKIEEAHYNNDSEFSAVLEYLIAKWMRNTIDDDQPLSLHSRVSCEVEGSYLRIKGDGVSRLVSGNADFFRFMDYIQQEHVSFREAAAKLGFTEGAQLYLKSRLQPLYDSGIFQENVSL